MEPEGECVAPRRLRIGGSGLRRAGLAGLGAAAMLASADVSARAAGGPQLELPYTCTRTSGRLTVVPAIVRSFELAGSHDVRRIAICRIAGRIPGSSGCAGVDVHRFELTCGKKRVAWAEVAASIALRDQARTQPRRPGLSQPNSFRPHAQGSTCTLSSRKSAGSPRARGAPSLSLDCRWPSRALTQRIALPAGFAPIEEAGGRLVFAAVGTAASGRQARPGPMQTLITSSPLPDITPPATTTESAAAPPVAAQTIPAPEQVRHTANLPLIMLSLLALVSTGAAVWRFPHEARRAKAIAARATLKLIEFVERHGAGLASRLNALQIPSRFSGQKQPVDIKATNAASAVSAMLSETTTRLSDLRGAGPLADVLNQEIGQLRQRLSALTIASAEGDEAAMRASPGFRNLVRDIERVARIADSAAISLGATRSPTRIPRTKSEAYDLLGLNPDAPDGTLKKVADGLRMSWHPDHARDDADRIEREARIKAINVAVELINGKRAAA